MRKVIEPMTIRLELDDSRRLTGKNLIWDLPGAILDVFIAGIKSETVVKKFQQTLEKYLAAIGWEQQQFHSRLFAGGASFVLSAPMDALYAATEINEAVWADICAELTQEPKEEDFEQAVARLKKAIEDESNPALLKLLRHAEQFKIPYLVDDEELTLGYGQSSQTWLVDALPDIGELDWAQFHKIPIAMVTGTNGKSTTVRLTAEMVNQSHRNCGVTSTDFIKVGDKILDRGDYSGPLGARTLIKHHDTECALLEVARGGLLRRGLAVPEIDAALMTNIASDHLGQYGINTVEELCQAKGIIAKGLTDGPLILNADDDLLVAFSKTISKNIIWFSIDPNHPQIIANIEQGKAVAFLDNDMLVYHDKESVEVMTVNKIPMTLSGAAIHNIKNILGAICLARALAVDWVAIRNALMQFQSDAKDNPGRGNQFLVNDARIIVDFAHNAHSMAAMAETASRISAQRRFLLMSSAGDRSDEDIIEMTRAALKMNPDFIYFAEVEKYLRGRELGETQALMKKTALELGFQPQRINLVPSPFTGTQEILAQLHADDLAAIMALTERDEIFQYLQKL